MKETEEEAPAAIVSRGIEVEGVENLEKLFHEIEKDKQTKTFVYRGVQFWKVNRRYQFSDTNELISYAPPISFETFLGVFKEFA
jgi:hypothetical protein